MSTEPRTTDNEPAGYDPRDWYTLDEVNAYRDGYDDAVDALDGIDFRCENYLASDFQRAFDLCASRKRPRGGTYGADRWCWPCEIRARLTGGQDR